MDVNRSLGYTYTVAQVAANFSILDRLDEGTNNEAAIVSAESGNALPNAPKNSATLSLDYGHLVLPFATDWMMRYHLDGNYEAPRTRACRAPFPTHRRRS